MSEQLEFRAAGIHAYAYVGTAFGLIFVASSIAAFAVRSLTGVIVGAFALGMGAAVLASAAYALRGRLRVAIDDDGWCTVTWLLGPWQRSKRFPRADVRSVQRYTSPPFAIMWPSIAGRQLRVEVQRGQPIDIGGGFELDDASLTSIEDLLR